MSTATTRMPPAASAAASMSKSWALRVRPWRQMTVGPPACGGPHSIVATRVKPEGPRTGTMPSLGVMSRSGPVPSHDGEAAAQEQRAEDRGDDDGDHDVHEEDDDHVDDRLVR